MSRIGGLLAGRLFPRAAALSAALLASLSLAGCIAGGDTFFDGNGRVAGGGGGEDFPNTVNRLGKIAAADAGAVGGWEELQNLELPEVPDVGDLDSLRVEPPLFRRAALGKRAASADCIPTYWTWDIQEFVRFRRIRKITCDEDSVAVRRDTLFYYYAGSFNPDSSKLPATTAEFEAKPDSFVTLVASRGSITWPKADKVQYFRASNLDSLGGLDHGDFLTLQYAPGRQSATIQRVKIYGRDGAYLSPAAAPEEFEYTRLGAAGDTLEWKRMRDADGDRAFYTAQNTGLVTFERMVRFPENEPGTARLTLFMKAQIFHAADGDSLKRLYYRDARVLRNGRSATFSFLGTDPDSVLRANDTAAVASDTAYAPADSMKSYHGVYTLLLGPAPEAMSGHSLVGFGIEKAWKRGPLRYSSTSFTPPAPAAAGQGRFLGVMTFTGAYVNGDSVRTVGNVTAEGMEMDYYGVKGGKQEAYRLLFDLEGNSRGAPEPIPAAPAARRAP
jgi:hypothetical protein